MEDNKTDNIGTEPKEVPWKSTLDLPDSSPWDSTVQKENAWETLHRQLQAERAPIAQRSNAGFIGRILFYTAAILVAIILSLGIGIALKNKHSVNLALTPGIQQPVAQQTVGNITTQGLTSPSTVLAPPPILGSKMGTLAPSKQLQTTNELTVQSQWSIRNGLTKRAQTTIGLPPSGLPSGGLPSGGLPSGGLPPQAKAAVVPQPLVSVDQPVTTPAPASLKGNLVPASSNVPAALKVISINELEASPDDATQDKKGKTMHALQIQWIHQSPHAEISYQDDKTPNAGIHVKVH